MKDCEEFLSLALLYPRGVYFLESIEEILEGTEVEDKVKELSPQDACKILSEYFLSDQARQQLHEHLTDVFMELWSDPELFLDAFHASLKRAERWEDYNPEEDQPVLYFDLLLARSHRSTFLQYSEYLELGNATLQKLLAIADKLGECCLEIEEDGYLYFHEGSPQPSEKRLSGESLKRFAEEIDAEIEGNFL